MKLIPLRSLRSFGDSFSFVGIIFATFFFAASLTPSLLPRIYIVQGLLSGLALAVGYGVGFAIVTLYQFLELPELKGRGQRAAKLITLLSTAVISLGFAWRMTFWQNSIRELMEMQPLESAYPYRVVCIAFVFSVLIIASVRLFIFCGNYFSKKLERVVPRKIALTVGYGLLVFLVLFITNDLIAAKMLAIADSFFLKVDQFVDEDLAQPEDRMLTGSNESLVPWESIGKQGKIFLTTGPTKSDIATFHESVADSEQVVEVDTKSKEILAPIRVYVGMRTAETPRERAKLALEELKRVGGFDRSVLIVATPTGTGWLDPSAVDTVEYLHRGDTAIVSTQYSYLPSWITILVDPKRSIESAIALFDVVYEHWKTLPAGERPKLYLYGLSLGSLGSENSADLLTLFENPINGAVWSGPPFPSQEWKKMVDNRNPDSPAWLPTFRDQRIVRFTAQKNALESERPWGAMRYVYIQYASDPMIWFSPDLAWVRPSWLNGERGPDVSPELRWYPIVTFLQIGCDIPMATSVPLGYGHNYSPSSYIDAWVAVTEPANWTPTKIDELKQLLKSREIPKP